MEYVPIHDIIHVLKLGLLAILELFLMSQRAFTLQHHVLRVSDSASEDRCINLLLSIYSYHDCSFRTIFPATVVQDAIIDIDAIHVLSCGRLSKVTDHKG